MAEAHGSKLIDKDGVAFADYPATLPKLCRHWPPANIIRSRDAVGQYRARFSSACQICGRDFCRRSINSLNPELHHIVGGAGRSDEPTNLLMVSRDCHDESWSVMLPQALYAKWQTDGENLSWTRLAVLLGHHLPEPKGASDENQGRTSLDN